ncbi:MAG: thiol:disulfide interchange protein DsbA/DsbL [Campylobacteraceae bacterium]|nr:thiol:disulfide interchange protein DsbA/DsbL [Campylobacteraceae bacterium]
MRFSTFVVKVATAIFLLSTSVFAFTEGTDYVRLDNPIPNADKTLIKVFSYDCPFCYKYDKTVTPAVTKKVEDVVKFTPYHLKTKGKYGTQASELFATLIVKDIDNGITNFFDEKSLLKKAKMAYYTSYHDKKERWDAGEADFLNTGLKAVNMTKGDFDIAKNDPRVKELLNNWEASYEVAKIQGVPAFVVNGKYLIYTKSIRSVDGMADLIKELADK